MITRHFYMSMGIIALILSPVLYFITPIMAAIAMYCGYQVGGDVGSVLFGTGIIINLIWALYVLA